MQDSEHVYELVYCSHRAVAQAAGDFLNVRLFSEQDVDPDIRTRRGKKRLENTPHIRGNLRNVKLNPIYYIIVRNTPHLNRILMSIENCLVFKRFGTILHRIGTSRTWRLFG